MTIRAAIWWQGEENCGYADAGNSLHNTGYSCILPRLLKSWREIWSTEPGTTDPTFAFGTVLLADGTDSGNPGNLANIIQAQVGILFKIASCAQNTVRTSF